MAILVFLNAWLITRLWFTFRDQPLPLREWLVLAVVQLLLIGLITPGLHSIILAAAVFGALALSEQFIPREKLNEGRLAGGFLVMSVSFGISQYAAPELWIPAPEQSENLRPFFLGLSGFLLVANETNLAIRVLLHRFQMEPKSTPSDQVDDREYNAGRVIGMLERWLIYIVVVLAQNYNVIALILAAKGIARFRQLEEREFAEYVLIGTLASILLTVMIGQAILYLLP